MDVGFYQARSVRVPDRIGALIRAAERWRGLRFTEFELRQIAAVRKELDAEYEAKLTPSGRSSDPLFPANLRLDRRNDPMSEQL